MKALRGMLSLTIRELWAMKITMGLFVVTTIAWVIISFALNLEIVEGSIAAIRLLGIESTPEHMTQDAGQWRNGPRDT